jgi:hypothetical protein
MVYGTERGGGGVLHNIICGDIPEHKMILGVKISVVRIGLS